MINKFAFVLLAGSALCVTSVFAEEAAAPERKPLESSIALGVTFNDGNTDNEMYNASFLYDRIINPQNTVRLALDGAYGETDNEKTTDNANAAFDYRRIFCPKGYGLFNTSYKTDDIADLDYRWIVSPGVGAFLMKKENVALTAEAGPAWISEKKGGETEDDFALRFAERYERTLNTTAKVWQSAEYIPVADDFDIYLLNVEIGVEAPVSESLNIRLVAKNAYDSDPAPGRESNDLSIIGALAYSLF